MMKKSEIYANYGIKFDRKANKLFCDPLNMWISPLLINGNKKIGRGCWHFSITAGNAAVTCDVAAAAVPYAAMNPDVLKALCGGTCNCNCPGCYAQTGCYTFFSTRVSLARKTFLVRFFLAWVERALLAQIAADKIKLCRIHAAGDFFSAAYVNMWSRIAAAYPDTVFWTYTKQMDQADMLPALAAFDAMPNCNIVKSVVDGYGFNFGHADYIIAVYHALKAAGKSVYICRCGIDKNQHCNDCHHCATAEYVLFLEHGTAYDPEMDPAYPAFIELVNSQVD